MTAVEPRQPIPLVKQPLRRRLRAVTATLRRCDVNHKTFGAAGCPDCSVSRRAVRGASLRSRARLVRFAWRTGLDHDLSIWCQDGRCGEQHYVAVYAR